VVIEEIPESRGGFPRWNSKWGDRRFMAVVYDLIDFRLSAALLDVFGH